jgi:hypothetical protein
MKDGLERTVKESAVPQSWYYPNIFTPELKRTTETSDRMACVSVEI